jgi:predicted TIM-barrel fold metal-dependent hydrolase
MNDKTAWLHGYTEQALEPELKICDPHHHLWNYPTSRYLVDEFLQDLENSAGNGGHRIEKTIYVECLQHYYQDGPEHLKPVGETAYIDKITHGSKQPEIAAGIIGFADMTMGHDVQPVLDAHRAASHRFRGVRHATAWHESDKIHNAHTKPPQNLLADKTFRQGIHCLDKLQLTFDAWLFFTQIPELIELAKAFPNLRIILNHIGGPLGIGPYKDQRQQVFAQWSTNIRLLAQCPNVAIKLGGMTMSMSGFDWHKQATPPSSTQLAEALSPYFHFCIEQFGVERCMFESNFPVDKISCSYTILWNAFKRVSQPYSTSERAALFYDTATTIYRV